MKRERPEYIWDAVRPFLIYNILFIAIRTVLSGILEYILLDPAQETVSVSLLWSEISQIAIIGITSVCAAIPLMGVGQRSIMIMRGRSEQAWITNRRDSRLLLSILPLGTLSLSVLLNLLLSESGASSEVPVSAAAIPAAAAVYGLLTPFIEELVYRGTLQKRRDTCRDDVLKGNPAVPVCRGDKKSTEHRTVRKKQLIEHIGTGNERNKLFCCPAGRWIGCYTCRALSGSFSF